MDLVALKNFLTKALAERDHSAVIKYGQIILLSSPNDSDVEHFLAEALLALKKWDEAGECYDRILLRSPKDGRSLKGKGLVARARGDHQGALEYLLLAVTASPTEAWFHFEVANEYMQQQRWAEARSAYDSVLALNPRHAHGLKGLGLLERQQGNGIKALDYFIAAATAAPREGWFQYEVAEELLAQSRWDEARDAYKAVVDFAPTHALALKGMGIIARSQGDRKNALEYFKAASDAAPDQAWFQFYLAQELLDLKRWDEARDAFQTAIRLSPGHSHALKGLGVIARAEGQAEAALKYFKAAAAATPSEAWFRYEVGQQLYALSRFDEAQLEFETLLKLSPSKAHAHALNGLGKIARAKGRQKEALQWFNAAAAAAPTEPWFGYEVGVECYNQNLLNEAQIAFSQFVLVVPDHGHAYRFLGLIARMDGNYEVALEYFQRALQCAPTDAVFALDIGETHFARNQLTKAEQCFNEILIRTPDHTHALIGLASIERARGHHERAFEHLIMASNNAANGPAILLELSRKLRQIGYISNANQLLDRIDDTTEMRAGLSIERAACAKELGNLVTAHEWLVRAVSSSPNHSEARLALAGSCLNQFELQNARDHYDVAIELGQLHEKVAGLTGKSQALRLQGDLKGALSCLDKALALDQFNESAISEFTTLCMEQRTFDIALQTIKGALAQKPKMIGLIVKAAVIERECGTPNNAIELLEGAIAQEPNYWLAYIEKAKVEFAIGQVEQSEKTLENVLVRFPNLAEAHTQLAVHRTVAGDLDGALMHLEIASKQKPGDYWLKLNICGTLARQGKIRDAGKLLAGMPQTGVPTPIVQTYASEVYRASGHLNESRQCIRSAYKTWPDHFDVFTKYIRFMIGEGDFEEAAKLIQSANVGSKARKSTFRCIQGELHLALWQLELARNAFLEGIEGNPRDEAAHKNIVICALLMGDLTLAEHHLRQIALLSSPERAIRRMAPNKTQSILGQIFEEMQLFGNSTKVLKSIWDENAVDRIAKISELVRNDTENTILAMSYMVMLRKAGHFNRNVVETSPRPKPIMPRKIMQYWESRGIDLDVMELMKGWESKNLKFEYARYGYKDALHFLEQNFDLQVVRAFKSASEPAQRSDLFRLAYLYLNGGFYVDADDRCLRSLDEIVNSGCEFVAFQEHLGSIANNFIGVTPRHSIIDTALRNTVVAINRGDRDILWLMTGPGMLTRSILRYLLDQRELNAALSGLWIMDRHEVQKYVAVHCVAAYKFTSRSWTKAAFGKQQ